MRRISRGRNKIGWRAMRKGSRFGGIDGDWKGFCKYFNKKFRRRKNNIEPEEG